MSSCPLSRAPGGLTLVELLVALTVLAVGLLALAGVTAGVMRGSLAGAWGARAAARLEARAEALYVASCDTTSGGATDGVLHERWTVRRDGELLLLVDSVHYALPDGAPHAVGVVAARWCPR